MGGFLAYLLRMCYALPISVGIPGRTGLNNMFAHLAPLNVNALMSYHVLDLHDDGGAIDHEHE
jgi:hypothetical protein